MPTISSLIENILSGPLVQGFLGISLVYVVITILPFLIFLFIYGRIEGAHVPLARSKKRFWVNTIFICAVAAPPIVIFYKLGWYQLVESNFWLVMISIILFHDLFTYSTHSLFHSKGFFGKIHGLHHLDRKTTIYSSQNFDILETIVNYSFLSIYLLIANSLLGGINISAVLIFLVYFTFRNIYTHGGVDLIPAKYHSKRYLRRLVTPTFHYFHHYENDGNFGFFFTVWDYLFGTVSPKYTRFVQEKRRKE